MSENLKTSPLAEIEALEAAVFRIGQLARRLRTEHPELPIQSMEPTVWALTTAAGPAVHAALEISAGSVDGVRNWATALGAEAIVKNADTSPYESATAEAVTDGVMVKVTGLRALAGDEYTAWQALRDQEGGEPR